MTTEAMVKALAKAHLAACVGGMLLAVAGLLEDREVKKLRERVLTLEAQVNDIRKKAEEAKENEEVDAE